MNGNATFETHDLYLSAALTLHGFQLIDLRRNGNSNRGIFVFKDRADRPQYVQKFFSGQLQGSLKGFSNTWADLRNMLENL